MKKIAFFMHNFNGGGAEKVTLKTATELAKKGYDVTLIMRECKGTLKDIVPRNIKVIDLKINNKSKIIRNLKNIIRLKKSLEQEKFDVVFGVTFNMCVLLGFTVKFIINKPRIIAIMHRTISQEKYKFMKIRKLIMNCVSTDIEKIVFVSEGARKDYIKFMKISEEKTLTIYNPIVSDEIFNLSKEKVECDWLDNGRDYKTILNIGRLSKEKNQILLLKAFKIVSEKVDSKLIILGEGNLKTELIKFAYKEKIDDKVMFYGFTKNPYAFLNKADLFVLSSDYEGLPTVLIEAMACGCNVVSTNCPYGPDEILDHGKYGILAKVNDEEDLAEKIINALAKPKVEKNILMKRANDFSVEKSISKYIKLIENE